MLLHWSLCAGRGDRMSATSMNETVLHLYLTAVINIHGFEWRHVTLCCFLISSLELFCVTMVLAYS